MKATGKIVAAIAVLMMISSALVFIIPLSSETEGDAVKSNETVTLYVDQGLTNSNIKELQKLGISDPTEDVWNYDSATKTTVFVMDGINFECTAGIAVAFAKDSSTSDDMKLTVVLKNDNTIKYGNAGNESIGISIAGRYNGSIDVTFTSETNGTLTVANLWKYCRHVSYGIFSNYNMTFTGNAKVIAKSYEIPSDAKQYELIVSSGIRSAQELILTAAGAKTPTVITTGGNICRDATQSGSPDSESYGLMCGTLRMSGGHLEASGGDVTYVNDTTNNIMSKSYGIYVTSNTGIIMNSGSICAYAGEVKGIGLATSCGIVADAFDGSSEGYKNVSAHSSDACSGSKSYSCGLYCEGTLLINNATVSASSGSSICSKAGNKGFSAGIRTDIIQVIGGNLAHGTLIVSVAPYTTEKTKEKMESYGIYYGTSSDMQSPTTVISIGDQSLNKDSGITASYKFSRVGTDEVEQIFDDYYRQYNYVNLFNDGNHRALITIDGRGVVINRDENDAWIHYDYNLSIAPEFTGYVPEGKVFSHYIAVDVYLHTATRDVGDFIFEDDSLFDGASITLIPVFEDQNPPPVSSPLVIAIGAVVVLAAGASVYFYTRK